MASIEEAKDIIKSTSISTIVSFYHPLNKRGSNFEAICPFHGDSHPSLKINDSKGIYKCFACGAAGDGIKFVQDKLNLDFIDAIKDISGNLGITIDEKSEKAKNPKYDMALRILQAANRVYKKVATEIKPEHFKKFLADRNLNEDSVKNFELGYAPNNNSFTAYLNSIPDKEKDFALSVAREIGIIRDNKRGAGFYDFYRDRVIFPIFDHSAKVRGFSSRAVLPDQKPKYLNSGESFVFDKGNTLYGFHIAKNIIRERDAVLVVEGNMDVVVLHQFGFGHSVGTMGVALSSNSIRLLSNMTRNIYLAMDSDPAGIKAMIKINANFLEIGIIPKFVDFSPAKDPDDFLNEFGRLELSKRIEDAPSFIDYQIKSTIPEAIPQNTGTKLDLLKQIFAILAPLKNDLMAHEKVISTAKALGLQSSNDDIVTSYKNYLEQEEAQQNNKFKPAKPAVVQEQIDETPPTQGTEPTIQGNSPQNIITKPLPKAEKLLLMTLIGQPECILSAQIAEILDLIEHFEVKRIVQWLKSIYLEIDEKDFPLFVRKKMQESLPLEIKEILASSLFSYTGLKLEEKVINKTLNDLIYKLKVQALIKSREELKIKRKNSNSDEAGLLILNEIQQIEIKLLKLKQK